MCKRVVFHSDLNNCYASIECVLHPELKGKYLAVCGSTEERHGIVLAKNELAKKCGVKTGDVIWEAKQKCPQLTSVPPHMDQYVKFSKLVRSIYLRYSPDVEAFGILHGPQHCIVVIAVRVHIGEGIGLLLGNFTARNDGEGG